VPYEIRSDIDDSKGAEKEQIPPALLHFFVAALGPRRAFFQQCELDAALHGVDAIDDDA
jgi:hypothetical protein